MITNTDAKVMVAVADLVGTPLILSDYTQAIVVLTLENSTKIIAEYKTSDNTLEIFDANAGIYIFNLKRSVTKLFPNSQSIYYTIRMYLTDADFEADLFAIESDPTLLETFTKTANYDRSN